MGSGVEGKSALDLAQAILERTGPDLPCWSVDDLCELAGVGVAKACRIAAAFELARRFSQRARPRIRKPEGALLYIQHLAGEKTGVLLVSHPERGWGDPDNHPSGLLEPTPADLQVTRQLVEAGRILGIEVLDHIIVTAHGFISLKEKGYI